jgi:hypothetical protein
MMNYEVNVSLLGEHFFATSERSITTLSKATLVFLKLSKAFPSEDGYKVSVKVWRTMGEDITESITNQNQ